MGFQLTGVESEKLPEISDEKKRPPVFCYKKTPFEFSQLSQKNELLQLIWRRCLSIIEASRPAPVIDEEKLKFFISKIAI